MAAFIGTICILYPVSTAPTVSSLTAIGLLLVTLFRRIVISSPFAPKRRLDQSLLLLEILSTAAIITIFMSISIRVSNIFDVATYEAFIPLVIFSTISAVLIEEFLFGDYLAWWFVKFSKKSEEDEHIAFDLLWTFIASVCRTYSLADRNLRPGRKALKQKAQKQAELRLEELQSELSEFVEEREYTDWIKLGLQAAVLYVILLGPLAVVSVLVLPLLWALLLPISLIFAHDHQAYLHVAYGHPSYEDFRHTLKVKWLFGMFYVILVYSLLP